MEPLNGRVTSPAPREVWQALVEQDEKALIFQTPVWTDALCSTGQYQDASRMYELRGGRTLVLPLAKTRSGLPALVSQASMPDGWGMGGLISSGAIEPQDVELVLTDLASTPARRTTIRPNPLTAASWLAAKPAGFSAAPHLTHILNLEGGFDQVWSHTFSTATRTNIRKAEKADLEIECRAGGDLLPVFYATYMAWIDQRARERRMPLPVARWLGRTREPMLKFQQAALALGDAFRVWVARLDGQVVAVDILLIDRCHAFYWRSASIKKLAGPVRANDLLQIHMIRDACSAGCRYYHMGESGGVDSLMHFKKRFGAEEFPFPAFTREWFPIAKSKHTLHSLQQHIESKIMKRLSTKS